VIFLQAATVSSARD